MTMPDIPKKHRPRIGAILLEYGLISQEQLARALDNQIKSGRRLGSVLEEMGCLDVDTLLSLLGKQYDLPFVNLFEVNVPPDVLKLLPYEQVKTFNVLPFKCTNNTLSVAMVNPDDTNVLQNVEFTFGGKVKPFVVPHYQMDKALDRFKETGYGTMLFEGEQLKEDKVYNESRVPDIHHMLKLVIDFKASDLHLSAGAPPGMRVNNKLKRLSMPSLTPAQIKDFVLDMLTRDQLEEFQRENELDFVLLLPDTGRFRVNIYRQRNSISLSARVIFEKIPSITDLCLPEWIADYALQQRGLILITGLAGHGKTTTMSSLVDMINSSRHGNIVTLEDPVEFLHRHNKCNVNQREIGIDTESFAAGLKHIVRQGPDVIAIGDLRDPESIAAALNAAESGHLVIAAIHSLNATTAIDRILSVFPEHQIPRIRAQLADTLLLTFSQKLIPLKDSEGRIAAYEKLSNSSRVAKLIREGKVLDIRLLMQDGFDNMFSIEQRIASLCLEGRISFEDGLKAADNTNYYQELVREGQKD